MEQQVARHSEEKRELMSTVKEDAVTKSSVQQIIYDIERESQAKIGRLLEENGLTSFTIITQYGKIRPGCAADAEQVFIRLNHFAVAVPLKCCCTTFYRAQGGTNRSVASRA